MNSRVRCSGCRGYFPRDGMRKIGLSFVCDQSCMVRVRERSDHPQARLKGEPRITRAKPRRKRVPVGIPDGVRNKVKRRDRSCRFCGNQGEQIHHITYRSEGIDHSIFNLLYLCGRCHIRVHSQKWRWQSVLRATIWYTYSGERMLVPEVEIKLIRLGLLYPKDPLVPYS